MEGHFINQVALVFTQRDKECLIPVFQAIRQAIRGAFLIFSILQWSELISVRNVCCWSLVGTTVGGGGDASNLLWDWLTAVIDANHYDEEVYWINNPCKTAAGEVKDCSINCQGSIMQNDGSELYSKSPGWVTLTTLINILITYKTWTFREISAYWA